MVGGEIATHPDVMGAHIKGDGGVWGHHLLQLLNHPQVVHRHAAELPPLGHGGGQLGPIGIGAAAEGLLHLHLQQGRQGLEAGV